MGLWIVEYSKKQGQFNVRDLDEILASNVDQFLDGSDPGIDFLPIGKAESHEKAYELVKELQKMRAERPAR